MLNRERLQYLAGLAEGMSVEDLNALVLLKGLNILANTAVDTANEGDNTLIKALTFDSDGYTAPTAEHAADLMDDMVHREEMVAVSKNARLIGVNVAAFFAIKRTPTSGYSYSTVRP